MAREGWPFIAIGSIVAVLFWLGANFWPPMVYGAIFFAGLSAFVVFFFRDPERSPPSGEGLIVSAADGKVVDIKNIERDEYLDGAAIQLSIFLSVFNVHINRVPISGVVDFVKWHRGHFRAAFVAAASTENEQSIIGIRSGSTRIIVKQIVGIVARRIVCRLQAGDDVKKGDRFGLIRFGSRVDFILPSCTQLHVSVGDRVRAGETIIGVVQDA